jgi:16S rRNA G966 N2-methylase RsmD
MRQRAELTFKHNRQHGRHGWLRLTPAYSVEVVDHVLDGFARPETRVLEPFSGTGTTALCAASRGQQVVALDINPFLVWLGRVKTRRYRKATVEAFRTSAHALARALSGNRRALRGEAPPIRNIGRWWGETELRFLQTLFHDLGEHPGPVGDLLRVAFCRSMMALSNAAFNHQSMSFQPPGAGQRTAREAWGRAVARFAADSDLVAASALTNPKGSARIELADSRALNGQTGEQKFDLVLTSPPYPNRMSYVRELRPYMYWLGHLTRAEEAGALDWQAIGGTWGVATSRLASWQPSCAHLPGYVFPILDRIRAAHPTNGELMARYVHKYFDDMWQHFSGVKPHLRRGATLHYIVGNSAFYGHLVPTERIYVDQLRQLGFSRARAIPLRKRNSKRELFEFHVTANA